MKKLALVICFVFMVNMAWAGNATVKQGKMPRRQQFLRLEKKFRKKYKNMKTALKKTDFAVKIEAIITIGTDNAADFARVMESDMGGCICQPLTGNPGQKVIPMTCMCRKKEHKWKIEDGKGGK